MHRAFAPVLTLASIAIALASCSSGDGASTGAPADDGTGGGVVVEQVSSDTPAGDLTEVVAAIEAAGYDCMVESFAMTSATRENCLTTSSVALLAYAWGDAATMDAEVDREVFCTLDSGLGPLTSLRGDTWAVSAMSLSGTVTPETQAAIDDTFNAIATTLGGELVVSPCR